MIMRALLVILAISFLPALAHAQKDPKSRAKAHFEAGEKLQRAGEYDQAIAEYSKGYAQVPLPAFLFNIAQAYRLKGDRYEAVLWYQKYLTAEPNGRASPEARDHIATLKKEIEAQNAEAMRRAAEEERRRAEERRKKEAAERAKQAEEEERLRRAEREREETRSSRGRGLRIAGIASAAAGVAFVAVATYFGLRAGDIEAEIEEKAAMEHQNGGSWTQELDDLVDDGESAERNMIVFSVVGGVAIAGGVTMYLLGVSARNRATESDSVTFVPSITPDGAGLFAIGRF
jgi:tetratricopeptide (TPR) repeat protein